MINIGQMTATMNNLLKLRNKSLHVLVLGLVVVTFVAYYRTGVDTNLPIRVSIIGQIESLEEQNASLNGTTDWSLGYPRNVSQDTSKGLRMATDNTSLPTGIWVNQTSPISSSPSEASIGFEHVATNATKKTSSVQTTSTTVMTTTARSFRADSTGAMYERGHDTTASDKCPHQGANLSLVIFITSAPSHEEGRRGIRQTWGHFDQRKDVAIIFVIGRTNDSKIEKSLRHEEDLYGDVVRGRFYDSYSNLTLKTMSSLEWVMNHCSKARFVLKTDDDMFINVPRLLAFVRLHEKDTNVIYGRLARKWKPFRNQKSKYYVSLHQYKPAVFPDFTTGPAYLLSRDIIEKLFDAALEHTYLKLEDVFITGIVAQKIGVRRIHSIEFNNTRVNHTPCSVQRAISIHMVKYKEQFDLWKKLLDGTTKCKV